MKRISFLGYLVAMAASNADYIGKNFNFLSGRFNREIDPENGATTLNVPLIYETPIVSKQFDENSDLQVKPFLLPPANSSDLLNETKYSELKEISVFKFTGFGPNGNNSLFSIFVNQSVALSNEPVDSTPVVGCKVNQLMRPVCASDGKMYRNLGHFICAKREHEDLEVLWDGPCNRSEWPTATVSANGTKIKVLNPEIILKYIKI